MRTLVVIHSLKMGGMERVAVNLADAFADEGHDSHLLSCRRKPNHLKPGNADVTVHYHDQLQQLLKSGIGIPVFLLSRLLLGALIPKSHYIWVGWLNGWLLKRHILRLEKNHGRFDRIIFRGIGTFKYFWSFRDSRNIYVLENILAPKSASWLRNIEARLLFHKRHLACVSRGVAASLKERTNATGTKPASVQVISNPCPVNEIRSKMNLAEPDLPNAPYIINVARLVPQKGHDRLLRAYALANPSQKLVIVGDGKEMGALQKLAKELHIEDRVIFAGQRENPYPWMRHADLFVLSSVFEGFGIVLTEALACGTPILSVDCPGGIRDILKGELEANIAEPSDEGLAKAISEFLAQPKAPAKEQWLDDFMARHIVNQFLVSPQSFPGEASDKANL